MFFDSSNKHMQSSRSQFFSSNRMVVWWKAGEIFATLDLNREMNKDFPGCKYELINLQSKSAQFEQ